MYWSPARRPWWPTLLLLAAVAPLPAVAQSAGEPTVTPPALPLAAAPADPIGPVTPSETLSLGEALRRFRADAPTEQQLAGRVAEAKAVVRLASAAALPIVAGQGGFTRNSDEVIFSFSQIFATIQDLVPFPIDSSGIPQDVVTQPLQQWNVGASVTVPLVQPTAWADIGAAKKAALATEGGTEAVRQQAEGGLVKAAWLSRAAEEVLAASDHAVASARSHRESAQRKYDAGTGTELEVLQASTELTRRESERLQAVANLDKTRRAMGALLGVTGPVRVQVSDNLDGAPSADAAATTAMASRPDVHAAEATVEAAQRSASSAWLRNLPTVAGTASVFGSDVAYASGDKTGWKLGLTATWVLYDGGARYGLLDKAHAQEMQAEGSVRQLTIDADRQARDAVAAVDVAVARLALANQAVETAARAEATAGRLYEAGLLSSLDALDAQQVRLDVEVARAGAIAQVGVARADLAIATGQGWPTR